MKKILVVDDDPDHVSILKRRFEANQHEVATASEKPDLIVLDVMMPNVDGYVMNSGHSSSEQAP